MRVLKKGFIRKFRLKIKCPICKTKLMTELGDWEWKMHSLCFEINCPICKKDLVAGIKEERKIRLYKAYERQGGEKE